MRLPHDGIVSLQAAEGPLVGRCAIQQETRDLNGCLVWDLTDCLEPPFLDFPALPIALSPYRPFPALALALAPVHTLHAVSVARESCAPSPQSTKR